MSRYRIFLDKRIDTLVLDPFLIDSEIEISAITIEVLDINLALVHVIEIKAFCIGGLDKHKTGFEVIINVIRLFFKAILYSRKG